MDSLTLTLEGTTLLLTVKSTWVVRGCNIAEDRSLHQIRCKNTQHTQQQEQEQEQQEQEQQQRQ